MRSAALRHGFGKGCLGEAGGTNQKKALFRVPSLIREGSDRLERGRRFGAKKKPGAQFGSRPLPVAGAVRFDRKLYGITKKGGACVGEPQVSATHGAKRKSPPQQAAFGYAKCLGSKRKRHLSVPFFFWCGRWDSNPHTEVLASKTRASTIPPLPLISLWPCTFTKQQADKYPYYTIFSLGLSIPPPVPTVRGLPVHRRCVRIES